MSPYKKATSNSQDDGQYHQDPAWGKEKPSIPSNEQQNPEQQPADGHPRVNQESTQHGSNIHAYDSQQLGWNQVNPAGESWGSVVDATQSPSPTQLHPTSHATLTSAPSIPTSSESGSSASSPAANAGIVLSVTAAVAIIAILILFPLYKQHKRRQRIFGEKPREVIVHHPLKGATQPLYDFTSKVYSQSARMACSMADLLRPKGQTSNPAAYLGNTHIGSETNNATFFSNKSPSINIYPTSQHSPPKSVSSWETELSKWRSSSSLAQSEDTQRDQTRSPNLGYVNGLETQENLSVGNLVAANPLDV